ncbi:MAG TPA: hypothetical protein VGR62_04615 [Candidatus Binatia bacterium]|nr:hypothetical protein [Candidatus Binatia bacterium]
MLTQLAGSGLDDERRKVIVSGRILQLLKGPWEDGALERIGIRTGAYFDAFIEQEFVTVRQGPPGDDNAQVARLEPTGRNVVELRCLPRDKKDDYPSIRVFGCLARKDYYVALGWNFRFELGKFRDPRWDAAIECCKRSWWTLFPCHEPLTGGEFPDDYITGAVSAGSR